MSLHSLQLIGGRGVVRERRVLAARWFNSPRKITAKKMMATWQNL